MINFIKKNLKKLEKDRRDILLMTFISRNLFKIASPRYSPFFKDFRTKVSIPTYGGTLSILHIRKPYGENSFKVEFQDRIIAEWKYGFVKVGSFCSGPYAKKSTDSFNRDMIEPFIRKVVAL